MFKINCRTRKHYINKWCEENTKIVPLDKIMMDIRRKMDNIYNNIQDNDNQNDAWIINIVIEIIFVIWTVK